MDHPSPVCVIQRLGHLNNNSAYSFDIGFLPEFVLSAYPFIRFIVLFRRVRSNMHYLLYRAPHLLAAPGKFVFESKPCNNPV